VHLDLSEKRLRSIIDYYNLIWNTRAHYHPCLVQMAHNLLAWMQRSQSPEDAGTNWEAFFSAFPVP